MLAVEKYNHSNLTHLFKVNFYSCSHICIYPDIGTHIHLMKLAICAGNHGVDFVAIGLTITKLWTFYYDRPVFAHLSIH